jgi:hypothetical protein
MYPPYELSESSDDSIPPLSKANFVPAAAGIQQWSNAHHRHPRQAVAQKQAGE